MKKIKGGGGEISEKFLFFSAASFFFSLSPLRRHTGHTTTICPAGAASPNAIDPFLPSTTTEATASEERESYLVFFAYSQQTQCKAWAELLLISSP